MIEFNKEPQYFGHCFSTFRLERYRGTLEETRRGILTIMASIGHIPEVETIELVESNIVIQQMDDANALLNGLPITRDVRTAVAMEKHFVYILWNNAEIQYRH